MEIFGVWFSLLVELNQDGCHIVSSQPLALLQVRWTIHIHHHLTHSGQPLEIAVVDCLLKFFILLKCLFLCGRVAARALHAPLPRASIASHAGLLYQLGVHHGRALVLRIGSVGLLLDSCLVDKVNALLAAHAVPDAVARTNNKVNILGKCRF